MLEFLSILQVCELIVGLGCVSIVLQLVNIGLNLRRKTSA